VAPENYLALGPKHFFTAMLFQQADASGIGAAKLHDRFDELLQNHLGIQAGFLSRFHLRCSVRLEWC
jgi:hypothetical protein